MNDRFLYDSYRDARDVVWKVLTRYKVVDFPVNVSRLAQKLNIDVNEDAYLPNGLYAVSYSDGKKNYIEFVSSGNVAVDRFTLAHELGHLLLRHKSASSRKEYEEEQANIFAARLLAPMIIIREHDPSSAAELSDIFGMSASSANIRFNRYLEIKKRNKFLTNSLEKEYYNIYKSGRVKTYSG